MEAAIKISNIPKKIIEKFPKINLKDLLDAPQ